MELASFHVYVTGVAERAGARVVWNNDPESTPCTDGKTIWIPRPRATATSAELTRLRYAIKHEACHIRWTDFGWWKAQKTGKLLHLLCNILEDHRIDYLNDSEFPGDVRLSAAFWADYAARTEAGGNLAEHPLYPVFLWDTGLRNWIATAHLVEVAMIAKGTPALVEVAKGLCEFSPRLLALRETPEDNAGLLALARDIIKKLGLDAGDSAEDETPPEGGKGKAEGKDGEGEEGEMPDMGPMPDDLTPTEGEGMPGAFGGGGSFTPTPVSTMKPTLPTGEPRQFPVDVCELAVSTGSAQLTNKLRHLLQVRALSHYDYGRKTGKLMQGALASMALTGNDRIFKKKVEGQSLDVAVSVLVDCSGSMATHSRYKNAAIAAACLSKALGIVGIKHAVHGFTNVFDDGGSPILYGFSPWGKPAPTRELLSRMSRASLQDNADAEFVLWAANDLMQQQATRRILLVMSDGQPACSGRTAGLRAATKAVIDEASKHVEVLGLGLEYDCSPYYVKNRSVSNAADIPAELLALFSSSF